MTKATKLALNIVGGLVLVFLGLYGIAYMFSPGSYVDAETYELNYSEDKVIQAVNKFKSDNPVYIVPTINIPNSDPFDLKDGREDSSDHWYHIYFFLKNENIIFNTWTRPSTKDKTTFAFHATNSGLPFGSWDKFGKWKSINKDFSSDENNKMKILFETRILTQIQNNLK